MDISTILTLERFCLKLNCKEMAHRSRPDEEHLNEKILPSLDPEDHLNKRQVPSISISYWHSRLSATWKGAVPLQAPFVPKKWYLKNLRFSSAITIHHRRTTPGTLDPPLPKLTLVSLNEREEDEIEMSGLHFHPIHRTWCRHLHTLAFFVTLLSLHDWRSFSVENADHQLIQFNRTALRKQINIIYIHVRQLFTKNQFSLFT